MGLIEAFHSVNCQQAIRRSMLSIAKLLDDAKINPFKILIFLKFTKLDILI